MCKTSSAGNGIRRKRGSIPFNLDSRLPPQIEQIWIPLGMDLLFIGGQQLSDNDSIHIDIDESAEDGDLRNPIAPPVTFLEKAMVIFMQVHIIEEENYTMSETSNTLSKEMRDIHSEKMSETL